MASQQVESRFQNALRDLVQVRAASAAMQFADPSTIKSTSETIAFADRWGKIVGDNLLVLSDSDVESWSLFAERIERVVNGRSPLSGQSLPAVLSQLTQDFKASLPALIYGLFEASGVAKLTSEDFPTKRQDALAEIEASAIEAKVDINKVAKEAQDSFAKSLAQALIDVRKTADEAAAELELTKKNARHISVESALRQFNEAKTRLTKRAAIWSIASGALFIGLVGYLLWLQAYPPTLITEIVGSFNPASKNAPPSVSVALLLAASAFFTSVRLAMVGLFGAGLAFSLRMTRAYLHMIEHNQHKLRVTNSIEGFIAAVLGNDQKDLVLGKLVESVTDFGDPGILGGKSEAGGSFPSVIFDSMTKNVGKPS